jgi:hypothetical protein
MTQVRFLAIGLKLFGLYLFLVAFQSIAVFNLVQSYSAEPQSRWLSLLPAVFLVFCGLAVWNLALPLARRLLPPESATDMVQSTPRNTFRIGCALLGLWLLTGATPELFRVIAIGMASESFRGDVAYCVVQFALAAFLLKGNAAVAAFALGPREAKPGDTA